MPTYDIAFLGPGVAGEVFCAGAEKLAQRCALALQQRLGKTPFAEGEGTDLMSEIAAGLIRSEADLLSTAAEACAQVQAQLQSEEEEDDLEEERLASLTPFDAVFVKSAAVLGLDVANRTGTVTRLRIALTPP
jgi:hypothetical protein